jgi:hypothetical protein
MGDKEEDEKRERASDDRRDAKRASEEHDGRDDKRVRRGVYGKDQATDDAGFADTFVGVIDEFASGYHGPGATDDTSGPSSGSGGKVVECVEGAPGAGVADGGEPAKRDPREMFRVDATAPGRQECWIKRTRKSATSGEPDEIVWKQVDGMDPESVHWFHEDVGLHLAAAGAALEDELDQGEEHSTSHQGFLLAIRELVQGVSDMLRSEGYSSKMASGDRIITAIYRRAEVLGVVAARHQDRFWIQRAVPPSEVIPSGNPASKRTPRPKARAEPCQEISDS